MLSLLNMWELQQSDDVDAWRRVSCYELSHIYAVIQGIICSCTEPWGRIQVQHVWVLLRSCLGEQVQTLASYRSFSQVSYSACPASPDGSRASGCASAFRLSPGSGCPLPAALGRESWACRAGARSVLARAARSIVALRSVTAKFFPPIIQLCLGVWTRHYHKFV